MDKLDTIQAKLDSIYKDLSSNITYIYDRDDMHLAIDLTFHSVLSFKFQGKSVRKGWVESLIVSDTRCGKSETADKLIQHYRLGEICSGENTSFAGLVGGMQQVGSRWHLSWGKIPLNDRRLVIIDEVSGLPQDMIGLMSGIRSSGIAEIVKINIEKTHARTRLIWLSNPRQAITINQHNTGVEVVTRLIGKPEDIARFDFALIMAADEVAMETINAYSRKPQDHIYTSDLCHKLLLWVWSRRQDQVDISSDTTHACLDATNRLCLKYSSEFPLVTVSEMKIKLARMAIALAARLFSTEDGEVIKVNPEHVQYIELFLNRIYSRACFSYDVWSKKAKKRYEMKNAFQVEALMSSHPALVDTLLEIGQVRVTDIEEVIAGDRKDAKCILTELLNCRALRKKHGFYVKSPAFIKMLRDMS